MIAMNRPIIEFTRGADPGTGQRSAKRPLSASGLAETAGRVDLGAAGELDPAAAAQ